MIFLTKKSIDQNAMKALDQMKLEIANELDANLTDAEKADGAMARDLVMRAEKQITDKDSFNPS